MKKLDFQEWCLKLNLNPTCRDVIAKIRDSPPSRRVQGRGGNVSGAYPSQKMGQTIQFESHTVELGAIYQMEHDPEVIEFYDQPPPFLIRYQNRAGRNIGHYHTPDFFVLRSMSAGWEEWKTEKQLKQLAAKYPTRYQQTESGWRSPAGEVYASQFGLSYSVRTDRELNPIFIQNLSFLEDYLRDTKAVLTSIEIKVRQKVQSMPGITLAELRASLLEVSLDALYALIARDIIYTNLFEVPLTQHKRVLLYSDKLASEQLALTSEFLTNSELDNECAHQHKLMPNTSLIWDGQLWTLVNLGKYFATLLPEVGQPIQLPAEFFERLFNNNTIRIAPEPTELSVNREVRIMMNAATRADLAKANHRFSVVQSYLQRIGKITLDVKERTLRDWVKKFRTAVAKYGCGYVGLLPRTAQRGNRRAKAPPDSSELLDKYISEYYETPRQARAISVYRAYQRACSQQKISPLSNSTFYQRLKKRRGYAQTKKRLGTKAAYPLQPWIWELAKSTPRHGDRPLAIAHIDHTQLDIELRSQATGHELGRPWATLLMDAYSRRILAVYLTFDPPSYRSCMMALRICVARFGRLPQTLVVDGGKEFQSVYFETLLARYSCVKKTRPSGKPRFGSVIERLFGTTNTEFIYNLLGNTQATKRVRQLTKQVDPKRLAVWTLGDLYVFLKKWAYQVYDQSEHEALGTTPCQIYLEGMSLGGERLSRYIPYKEEFLMATRPTTASGVAKVRPGAGIKIHYIYYWSDAFAHPEVERTKVPVRYDPFDVGVAYAYVQGRWVKCISQYYSIFEGHSEKELLLASSEIRRMRKSTRTITSVSAKRLADLIANAQEHETLLLQRLKDLEGKKVQNALHSAEAETEANDVPSQSELIPRLGKTHSSVKETEFKNLPINLLSLPVFEEYR